MKIDCPHCGVHGSVDDSLAEKKLRCPKCRKVFLINSEDILSRVDPAGVITQESHDTEQQNLAPVAQGLMAAKLAESVGSESDSLLGEAEEVEEIEEIGDTENAADSSVEICSACAQSFAAEFLEEVDSKLYCAMCLPDTDDEMLEIQEEDSLSEEASLEEDELLDLMDDGWDGEEEASDSYEMCSECGESLNRDFLVTVGSKRYCTLCLPELDDEQEDFFDGLTDEVDDTPSEELQSGTDETDSGPALLGNDDLEEESSKEPCSVCGEEFYPDFLQEIDSKLFCGICQPEVTDKKVTSGDLAASVAAATATATAVATGSSALGKTGSDTGFTIGQVIKVAWQKTKGAKASVWGGIVAITFFFCAIAAGGWYAYQNMGDQIAQLDQPAIVGLSAGIQLIVSWLSMVFSGGLMLIGIRRVLEKRLSWKIVFAGFRKALTIAICFVLQTILVTIGFVLLVLPGIYLLVGYTLSLPLIIDKGLGPWAALEVSRKAIHKKWWTVFGVYLVMSVIGVVSALPAGLGLIWTIPMYFVLIGVLYVQFFGSGKIVE